MPENHKQSIVLIIYVKIQIKGLKIDYFFLNQKKYSNFT